MDIVERLRQEPYPYEKRHGLGITAMEVWHKTACEAADEIERLEAQVEVLQNKCAQRGLSPEDSDALQADNERLRAALERTYDVLANGGDLKTDTYQTRCNRALAIIRDARTEAYIQWQGKEIESLQTEADGYAVRLVNSEAEIKRLRAVLESVLSHAGDEIPVALRREVGEALRETGEAVRAAP